MIVIDVEASGLDPTKHSIVSIGALDFSNPTNQFYQECRMWEGAEILEEALRVNGFTEEQCRSLHHYSLAETMHHFFVWADGVKDKTFAGQNPRFDHNFLVAAAKKSNLVWRLGHRTIDMHSLAYMHMLTHNHEIPIKNNRSDLNTSKILQYVGLPEQSHVHNALTDAKMTGEAISRILFGKNLLEEYKQFAIPELFRK